MLLIGNQFDCPKFLFDFEEQLNSFQQVQQSNWKKSLKCGVLDCMN